jgi:hypothetical protein
MAASKGMPLLAAVAAIMVVSYTVFRLNYAANNLPYDPGDPLPAVEVTGSSPEQLTPLIRNAILSRHSVRVAPPSEAAEATLLEVWPLRGLELERAILRLDERIVSARQQPASGRDADSREQFAVLVAARELVEQDRAFVIEAGMPTAVPGWHAKLLPLFQTKNRNRVLYIPINDAEFEFLRTARTADPKTFDPR